MFIIQIDFRWKKMDLPFFRLRRGGSRGFVLRDETVDEEFLKESLEAEQKWLGRFRQCQPAIFQKKESSASSRYSFSTEYSSGKSFWNKISIFERNNKKQFDNNMSDYNLFNRF